MNPCDPAGEWHGGDLCQGSGLRCGPETCAIAHFEMSILAEELHDLAPEEKPGGAA